MQTLFSILAFIVALAAHESAHAWSAHLLGDTTARDTGRMTLNPLAHIDPLGTLILPAVLILTRFPVVFGWAKPVPVDPSKFSSPRKGLMITSAAGPAANFIVAMVCAVFLRLISAGILPLQALGLFFFYCMIINIIIGLFNLIPVPPLDGSNIVAGILAPDVALSYMRLSRYGMIILFVLLYLGLFQRILLPIADLIIRFLMG